MLFITLNTAVEKIIFKHKTLHVPSLPVSKVFPKWWDYWSVRKFYYEIIKNLI